MFNEVVYLLSLSQGNVVINSRVIIPEIFYHAFIAEAPIQSFDDLSESTAIRFLKSDQILFFRPVGQLVALSQEFDEELPSIEEPTGLSSGNPIAALVDGLPLQNHALLQDRLIIDDPFNFSSNYLPQKRLHGTAMASLIIHGDLNDANSHPLSRPIYVCPIMKPNEAGEFLPNDKLPLRG